MPQTSLVQVIVNGKGEVVAASLLDDHTGKYDTFARLTPTKKKYRSLDLDLPNELATLESLVAIQSYVDEHGLMKSKKKPKKQKRAK